VPTPALYFDEVGYVIFPLFFLQSAHSTKCRDGSQVTAQLTPILRVYLTSDYQESTILRGAIETPAIWSQDLTGLAQHTAWNLKRDPSSGRYTLVHA
jgi:hypothetical protein